MASSASSSSSSSSSESSGGSSEEFDLVVIGGGSGGVRCARISATHGARVALVEHSMKHGPPTFSAIGGTCVNVGCVPKKLLVYAGQFHEEFKAAEGFGWKLDSEPRHDWQKLIEHKNKEITRLNGIYDKLLGSAGKEGVKVFEGSGRLTDKNTVVVQLARSGQEVVLRTKHVLLAVGGWPHRLPVPGADLAITSNEAFYLKERPNRIVVVGGGYVAVEFASIFNALGSQVTLMYRGELILRGFDNDIRKFLFEEMKKKNINLQMKEQPTKIEKMPPKSASLLPPESSPEHSPSVLPANSSSLKISTESGKSIEADAVMFATGRKPRLEGLNLEAIGVRIGDRGEILVDERARTNIENIYAVGDCTDRVLLTPMAIREGHYLADRLFNNKKKVVNYELIPSAVFSQPEIGTVGLTEEKALEKHKNLAIYTNNYRAMKNTLTSSTERGFMKVIVDEDTDRVLGIHIVGEHSGEIIQGFAAAVQCGLTKGQLDDTLPIHPTAAEELCTLRSAAYRYVNRQKLAK